MLHAAPAFNQRGYCVNRKIVSLLCVTAAAAAWGAETGRQHVVFSNPLRGVDPAAHVREMASRYGVGTAGAAGIYLHKSYRTEHNGVTHQIYRQQFQGIDVHEMEWAVNLDRDGAILNSGGTLTDAPAAGAVPPTAASAIAAARAAVRSVNPKHGERFLPAATRMRDGRPGGVVFAAGPLGAEIMAEITWFPLRGELIPAWLFNVVDADSSEAYNVVVEAGTDRVLSRRTAAFFQRPAPKALVFPGESPQANPNPGVRLSAAPPLVERTLVTLEGNATASPEGWVTGSSTIGNNAIAGQNSLGTRFLTEPRVASLNAQGEFSFPFQFGADTNPFDYSDAAVTNLFYWVNRAHDFFYANGFDEAAGNFQQSNFTQSGAAGDPMLAYAHFSVAGAGGASTNNAFFTARSTDDGAASMIAMYVTTGGALRIPGDTSLDAGIIVHEYTHGVSYRLVRNGYTTFQGAAMGEAWSDFFALEMLTPEGAPVDGVYPVGEYFLQSWGNGIRTRPYTTDMELNPITYARLGQVSFFPQVHADGEIWVQCLWQMRANLIRQFGEREGRRRARLLVIDGMKLAIPAPSMVDARDAILLADRAAFRGESQQQIWQAFAKRGMGALAYTPNGSATEVIASFEVPGAPAAAYFGQSILIGQNPVVVISDPAITADLISATMRSSSGDIETFNLRRRGSVFAGAIAARQIGLDSALGISGNFTAPGDGVLQVLANDSITVEYKGASARVPVKQPYVSRLSAPPADLVFPRESRLPVETAGLSLLLPFEFPYYGRKYSVIDVMPSGRLGFGLSSSVDTCFDDFTFRAEKSIAPLFADIYVSTFDNTLGVFTSSTADSITFRWKGILLSGSLPPVNFAATLFRNGNIRFDYGAGNQQLHTPTPLSGCGRGPVAGLSPGTGSNFDSFIYPSSFERAPSVNFDGASAGEPGSEGYLDSATITGVTNLVLVGGMVDRQSVGSRADVLVDGVYSGILTLGSASAAVCTRFGLTAPCPEARSLSGTVNLLPRRLSQGTHRVQVRLTNVSGVTTTIPAEPLTFEYTPPQRQVPVGGFDSPLAGATVSGSTLIRGYVYMPVNRITRVDFILDGGATIGGINYGFARTDVCAALPSTPAIPNCPGAGFQGTLNTVGAPIVITDGEHTLSLRVLDNLGNLISMPETAVTFTVNNSGAQPPTGVLATPENGQTISGSALIWGYAWSPFPGRRITSAVLVVDGTGYQTLTYGEERGNECATIGNPPAACPNIGFSGFLNTQGLTNGLHSIGVRVTNDRGESVVIPSVIRQGVNVFVQN